MNRGFQVYVLPADDAEQRAENLFQSAGAIRRELLMANKLRRLKTVFQAFTSAFSSGRKIRPERGSLFGDWLTDTVGYYH